MSKKFNIVSFVLIIILIVILIMVMFNYFTRENVISSLIETHSLAKQILIILFQIAMVKQLCL